MCKVINVLKEGFEACLAGDEEKYLSLISERSKDTLDKMGGVGIFMELFRLSVDEVGEEAAREISLASVAKYKLVDGKLEDITLEALSETSCFEEALLSANEGLEAIMEFMSEEEEENV